MPYDESADPQRDLQTALAKARKENKRVLVVFGANWCPDCRALDHEFHAGGKTDALVAERYEVVKVDVGRFDKNLDFAKLYGEPIKKGIPSVVVVTPANEVVYQTKAGELADARSMGPTASTASSRTRPTSRSAPDRRSGATGATARVHSERPAGHHASSSSSGTLRPSSSSQMRALPSDGARQSPRGDRLPPDTTFGPFGIAERLNWLISKKR